MIQCDNDFFSIDPQLTQLPNDDDERYLHACGNLSQCFEINRTSNKDEEHEEANWNHAKFFYSIEIPSRIKRRQRFLLPKKRIKYEKKDKDLEGTCMFVCLSVKSLYLPACLPACLSDCLPECMPTDLTACLPVYLSACLHAYLYASLSV